MAAFAATDETHTRHGQSGGQGLAGAKQFQLGRSVGEIAASPSGGGVARAGGCARRRGVLACHCGGGRQLLRPCSGLPGALPPPFCSCWIDAGAARIAHSLRRQVQQPQAGSGSSSSGARTHLHHVSDNHCSHALVAWCSSLAEGVARRRASVACWLGRQSLATRHVGSVHAVRQDAEARRKLSLRARQGVRVSS